MPDPHRRQESARSCQDPLRRGLPSSSPPRSASSLLKTEQARITTAIAGAEGRLAAIAADFQAAETNLHRALTRAGDCQAAYREATDRMRRQFNLAFFKRLMVDEDGIVSGELAELFDVILGEELRRAAIARESEDLKDTIRRAEHEKKRRPREPESVLVGATAAAPDWGDGWSPNILVRPSGLEPPRGKLPTRPSTLDARAIYVRRRPDSPIRPVCGRIGHIGRFDFCQRFVTWARDLAGRQVGRRGGGHTDGWIGGRFACSGLAMVLRRNHDGVLGCRV
jgi:hypothetical protein